MGGPLGGGPNAFPMGALLRLVALSAVVLSAAVLVLSFGGRFSPALDSLSHFRAHLCAAAFLCGLLALPFSGVTRLGGLACLVLSASAFVEVWLSLANPSGNEGQDASLRILQMNLLVGTDPQEAIDRIRQSDADIVTLQEVGRAQWQALSALPSHPHAVRCDDERTSAALAILSRHPFAPGASRCLPPAGFLSQRVALNGAGLTVVSQHLPWPWPFRQKDAVAAARAALETLPRPIVVGGDFNAVPWSRSVRQYAAAANLTVIPGIGGTWPARFAQTASGRFFALPIDRVLASPTLDVTSAARLAATRSDHLPLLVGLTFAGGNETAGPTP